uniref:Uncharacterized protein n=1 Tax=viral metagenome TaxID=1070528 RepID=A0A6M3IGX6_9ZZZZ
MNWEPWIKYRHLTNNQTERIDLTEPPCKYCYFWRPQTKFIELHSGATIFDGVICCAVEEMQHDFSCFRKGRNIMVKR